MRSLGDDLDLAMVFAGPLKLVGWWMTFIVYFPCDAVLDGHAEVENSVRRAFKRVKRIISVRLFMSVTFGAYCHRGFRRVPPTTGVGQ